MGKSISWGKVANWYNNLIEQDENSYQRRLILPSLLRLVELKRGEVLLDLACGQGFFSRELAKLGAKVIGVDISAELINIARLQSPDPPANDLQCRAGATADGGQAKQDKNVEYHVSSADKLDFLKDKSIDKVVIILALQNIEKVGETLREVSRVLKEKGRLFIILNHPAFRIPKQSSWGWDESKKVQYRRIDSYLSESKEEIQMHPGEKPWEKTISFHRPLQFYFKALNKHGFVVSKLEEWVSHKISEEGPKKEAEDRSRHEFPLFLFLEAIQVS